MGVAGIAGKVLLQGKKMPHNKDQGKVFTRLGSIMSNDGRLYY